MAIADSTLHEGKLTEKVDRVTSKVPSLAYLGFAVGSIAASLGLMVTGRKSAANFVGQWAPTILILGLYNKVVKEIGTNTGSIRRTA